MIYCCHIIKSSPSLTTHLWAWESFRLCEFNVIRLSTLICHSGRDYCELDQKIDFFIQLISILFQWDKVYRDVTGSWCRRSDLREKFKNYIRWHFRVEHGSFEINSFTCTPCTRLVQILQSYSGWIFWFFSIFIHFKTQNFTSNPKILLHDMIWSITKTKPWCQASSCFADIPPDSILFFFHNFPQRFGGKQHQLHSRAGVRNIHPTGRSVSSSCDFMVNKPVDINFSICHAQKLGKQHFSHASHQRTPQAFAFEDFQQPET